jgi:hypothetical protein
MMLKPYHYTYIILFLLQNHVRIGNKEGSINKLPVPEIIA